MPSGIPLKPYEIQEMLDMFNDCRKKGRGLMESYRIVGAQLDRDPKRVQEVISRLRPTTDVAKMYFRANALQMAMRIKRKANVGELIDVLSRPSIGVLDPIKKVESGPGGFFLTVNAESCGAVKVGVLQPGADEPKQLESGDYDPFSDVIDVGQEAGDGENGDAQSGPDREEEQHAETVIERVRRQLAQARRARE